MHTETPCMPPKKKIMEKKNTNDIISPEELAREEHIDNFLNDIMTDEEFEAFEAELETDHQLAEDVDFTRVVATGVRYNAFKDMLGEMKDKGMLDDDNEGVQEVTLTTKSEALQPKKKVVIRYINRALAAAACVIGVVGISYIGMNQYQSEMNANIAGDRIASFDWNARGGETLLEKAINESKADNIKKALALVAELEIRFAERNNDANVDKEAYEYRQAKIEYDEALYLKALLLIKRGEVEEARNILRKLQDDGFELYGLLDRLK